MFLFREKVPFPAILEVVDCLVVNAVGDVLVDKVGHDLFFLFLVELFSFVCLLGQNADLPEQNSEAYGSKGFHEHPVVVLPDGVGREVGPKHDHDEAVVGREVDERNV